MRSGTCGPAGRAQSEGRDFITSAPARGAMLGPLERMGNKLPPRLKALLNLAISLVLVLLGVPLVWAGAVLADWGEVSLGVGLLLLAVFNLFT